MGRISTVDLLEQTSLYQPLYILKILFTFFIVLSLPLQLVFPVKNVAFTAKRERENLTELDKSSLTSKASQRSQFVKTVSRIWVFKLLFHVGLVGKVSYSLLVSPTT
jgi:hypothetical protein